MFYENHKRQNNNLSEKQYKPASNIYLLNGWLFPYCGHEINLEMMMKMRTRYIQFSHSNACSH